MSRVYRAHCFLFERLLSLQSDDLVAAYGDEIRSVFDEELRDAWSDGVSAILVVWRGVIAEAIILAIPRALARIRLALVATCLASLLTIGFAFGFCTLGASPVVHACSQQPSDSEALGRNKSGGSFIQLPNGHHMFLECSGDTNATPTVILANGRGLGTADSWKRVQEKINPSIRVCSYDAMGAGQSDPVQGNPQFRPIDQVVADMHDLFQSAGLKQPYVLVGASDGALLARRYQQQYEKEIGGLVFVDSSHEEMQWREAAIAPQFNPNWNNPVFLRENGFLANQQKLTWRADMPLIDLERSEKAPLSAFSGLMQQQVDAINALWHDYQVDLAGRSKLGQLRIVPNSGHRMHIDRPDAVAEAVEDVVRQVRETPIVK
jgi:pimeloyl-ACP methyl ester carboxylesterase